MKSKIVGILICTLLIATVFPVAVAVNCNNPAREELGNMDVKSADLLLSSRDGWGLQWSHAYGGNGHSQYAQPIGDIDEDGVNEVIIGGYETSGICRILSYDPVQETYVQEYSWVVSGGSYNSPSGVCVVDLDEDGDLEFCVSWVYSGADGVYAYDWDGTELTQFDRYYSTGFDFAFDIYACDYDDDGHMEVLIANAPNMGGGSYHVTALGWDISESKFVAEAFWACPGGSDKECPMVWSGDVDNDGKTEVIADVSNAQTSTAGTWALNWNDDTESWDGVPVWTNYPSATVYGDSVGDIDGDGTPEIGIGSYGGTPSGWLFEWDGTEFQQVWNGQYPSGQPVIEAVAIGDADNDGSNEFCIGAGHIHVIGWDGTNYVEEATFTDPTGMLAGMNIGDCDSDGSNEVKACEILSGTGSEFIYKYYDTSPPTTTHTFDPATPDGENDWYVSCVTVTLDAIDEHSSIAKTEYKIDGGTPIEYYGPWPFGFDECECIHTLEYRSIDASGNEETWKGPFDINIDTAAPTIRLTKTTIIPFIIKKYKADVEDLCSGINRVEFYVDNQLKTTDTSIPYEYMLISIGSHTVTAKVYDNAGNSNTATSTQSIPQQNQYQGYSHSILVVKQHSLIK